MSPTYYGGGTGTSTGATTTAATGNATAPVTPLETWRREFEYHPYHFWGVSGSSVPVVSSCNALVREYNWQASDRGGRADVRKGIIQAEARLTTYLGFSPVRHYVEEEISFPRYFDPKFERIGYTNGDGRWIPLQMSEGEIIAAGAETLDLVGAANVVYTDEDGDGVFDTFTAVVPTTVTDPDELAAYFQLADRLDSESASDRWLIAPVRVSIAGGLATITGRAWMLVRPILYEGFADNAIDVDTPANFVTAVDVYHRRPTSGNTFDTAAAVLIWETRPFPYFGYMYPSTTTDPAAYSYALGRVNIRDGRAGIVSIGESVYDATAGTWAAVSGLNCWKRPPDRAILRYYAGSTLPRAQSIVSRMAACEMANPICACETANRAFYHWSLDLSRSAGNNDEAYQLISQGDLNNPFGAKRGQINAWREVRAIRRVAGFSV